MFVQDLHPFRATTAGWDPWSVLRRTLQVGPEHLFKGKGNGDEEEDGADGAGLVVDDEVGGVEDEQEQVAWQHEQGWPKVLPKWSLPGDSMWLGSKWNIVETLYRGLEN